MAGYEVPKLMLLDNTVLVPSLGGVEAQARLASPSIEAPSVDATTPSFEMPDIFKGLDIKGIGTIASVIGGIVSSRDDKKYKKELLKREDARIARATKQEDKFNADMSKAYA